MNETKKRFLKNGLLLTAVGVSMRTAGMVFSSFVTKKIGAEGMGLYTLLMTVYNFAVTLATFGIGLTVTRLVASSMGENKEAEAQNRLRGSMVYATFFGGATGVGLLFAAGAIGEIFLRDLRGVSALRILALSLLPIALTSALVGWFVAVGKIRVHAAAQVGMQCLRILLTVFWLNACGRPDAEEAVTVLAAAATLTEWLYLAVCILIYKRSKRGTSKSRGVDFSSVWKTALPLGISAIIRSALLTVEHLLIPQRLLLYGETEAEALASYGVLSGMALPMILYPMALLTSFSGLLVPEFARDLGAKNQKRMERTASYAADLTLIYAVAVSAGLFLFSEEIGRAVYDSARAGYFIAVLAPILPVMYLDHVTDSMLKGIGEQVYSMWVNISDSLLSILLVWILLPRCGILGYAYVILIMEGYNFLLSFFRLRKKVPIHIRPGRAIFLPLTAAGAAAGVTKMLFPIGGSGSPAVFLVLKLVFLAVAFLFFFLVFKGIFSRFGRRRIPFPKKA